MVEMYCLKCKKKQEVKDEKENYTLKGMKILKAKCKICNTTCCKMLGKK
jgi:hypothetical protein